MQTLSPGLPDGQRGRGTRPKNLRKDLNTVGKFRIVSLRLAQHNPFTDKSLRHKPDRLDGPLAFPHNKVLRRFDSLALKLPTVESECMYKKTELDEFKQLLLVLRSRIRGDVQHMQDEVLDRPDHGGDSKSPTHLAELGTETYEQDFALRRVENEQEVLEEIDEALRRVEDGSYGLCGGCQEAGKTPAKSLIPKARLRVIPYARNCVECERKREELHY